MARRRRNAGGASQPEVHLDLTEVPEVSTTPDVVLDSPAVT
jgi:hypothetical protein